MEFELTEERKGLEDQLYEFAPDTVKVVSAPLQIAEPADDSIDRFGGDWTRIDSESYTLPQILVAVSSTLKSPAAAQVVLPGFCSVEVTLSLPEITQS